MMDDHGSETAVAALPDGQYAIIDIMGHVRLIGRVQEVDRYGVKMIQIEPIFRGKLLAPLRYGGSAIYCETPCSADQAVKMGATQQYQLPEQIRWLVAADAPAPLALQHVIDDYIDYESAPPEEP